MYSVFAVDPAVSFWEKKKPSLNDFPDYSGYSQGKTQNYMRIFPIFPNIRNPLQDTAEILKYAS